MANNFEIGERVNVELPPRYTVRDYLKQQGKKLEALSFDHTAPLLNGWRDRYLKRRVDADALKEMGGSYLDSIRASGGFSLVGEYRPPSSVSPHRERFLVSGYTLEPVGLGQGWVDLVPNLYVENAALLRSHVGDFRRKKASLGSGISCVALTQHLLERIYERTEVQRADLGNLIESEMPDLLRALALAETASLWIEVADGGQACRVTAVPFSNGLLIANERYLFGDHDEGDFGFRCEVPSGRMHEPFVNNGRVLDELGEGRYFNGRQRPIVLICGVTYMNVTTLDDAETDYYYSFKAALDSCDRGALDALAFLEFAPTLPHQKLPKFMPLAKDTAKFERLRAQLTSGWLKPKLSRPLCLLLPYDAQIPKSAHDVVRAHRNA